MSSAKEPLATDGERRFMIGGRIAAAIKRIAGGIIVSPQGSIKPVSYSYSLTYAVI